MKALVVYSSRTGNTRKIAEAIAAVLPGSGAALLPERHLGDVPVEDAGTVALIHGLKDAAENRVQSQEKAFDGYGTNQMKLLANAVIETKGNYLFYCVAENPGKYEEVFRHAVQ